MFDGSLIGGWKSINKSNMVLMSNANMAVLDLFFEESTLDRSWQYSKTWYHAQGYDCDPRSISKRAEDFLRSSGIVTTALFIPEPEFFLFDDIRFGSTLRGAHVAIDDSEGTWISATTYDGGNKGHRPPVKGGYFPVPRSVLHKTSILPCV